MLRTYNVFALFLLLASLAIQILHVDARDYSPGVTAGFATNVAARRACILSDFEFQNSTVFPSSPLYEQLREVNSGETAWLDPACFVLPATTDSLSTLIKIVVALQAPFSIRSGGHSQNPGWASSDGGVLIDLSRFDEITYRSDMGDVILGTGARWDVVYSALERYNVSVAGGRSPGVGVGGYTLGCGLSFLSNKYGLGCDNVQNFEVVLANGSIVNASRKKHTDLFWALKGGGSNFGIVTRFTYRALPVGSVWGGLVGFANENIDDILTALVDYQNNGAKDENSNVLMYHAWSDDSIGIFGYLFYAKPVVKPDCFAPFYKIPMLYDMTNITTLSALVGQSGSSASSFPRWSWRDTAFKINSNLYHKIPSIAEAYRSQLDKVVNGVMASGFQPIQETVLEQGRLAGGNALGLTNFPQTWFISQLGYTSADDDQQAQAVSSNVVDGIAKEAQQLGALEEFIFMSDSAIDQDVIASYGPENVQRLKMIARRYDPAGVFQTLKPGGYKLP